MKDFMQGKNVGYNSLRIISFFNDIKIGISISGIFLIVFDMLVGVQYNTVLFVVMFISFVIALYLFLDIRKRILEILMKLSVYDEAWNEEKNPFIKDKLLVKISDEIFYKVGAPTLLATINVWVMIILIILKYKGI